MEKQFERSEQEEAELNEYIRSGNTIVSYSAVINDLKERRSKVVLRNRRLLTEVLTWQRDELRKTHEKRFGK